MVENNIPKQSIRELKLARTWHRNRRKDDTHRQAYKFIDGVIKKKQAKVHQEIMVNAMLRYQQWVKQRAAMEQLKQMKLL